MEKTKKEIEGFTFQPVLNTIKYSLRRVSKSKSQNKNVEKRAKTPQIIIYNTNQTDRSDKTQTSNNTTQQLRNNQ